MEELFLTSTIFDLQNPQFFKTGFQLCRSAWKIRTAQPKTLNWLIQKADRKKIILLLPFATTSFINNCNKEANHNKPHLQKSRGTYKMGGWITRLKDIKTVEHAVNFYSFVNVNVFLGQFKQSAIIWTGSSILTCCHRQTIEMKRLSCWSRPTVLLYARHRAGVCHASTQPVTV